MSSTAQPLNGSTAIFIFFAALAVHLTYFIASNEDFFYPDSETYLVPSQNLGHGLGFVDADGRAETIRRPVIRCFC